MNKLPFLRASIAGAALLATTIAAGALTNPLMATQKIPNGELQRWIYGLPFPVSCGAAHQQTMKLRVKPSTAAPDMHDAITAFAACAKTPSARNNAGLQNTAIFGYAAAALMAARNEPAAAALTDARSARDGGGYLSGYTKSSLLAPGASYVPSAYRTNADQIYRDAGALVAALKSGSMGPAPAASGLPAPSTSPR